MSILKGRKSLYLIGCVLYAMQNLMGNVLTGQLYRTVIRLSEGDGFQRAVLSLLWLLIALAVVSLSIWIGQAMYMKAVTGAERGLRRQLVSSICHMPFGLWIKRPASDWVNLFSRDSDAVMDAYKQRYVSMLTQGLSCAGSLVLVLSQNIAMGLFSLGCGVLYFICIFVLKQPMKQVQYRLWQSLEKGSRVLAEMTKGLDIIRFYQLENHFYEKYQAVMKENYQAGRSQVRVSAWAQTSKNFGYSFSYVGSLIFGLVLVSKGQLVVADMMYLWQLGMGISYGVQSLGFQLIELQENRVAFERVQEGLDLPQEESGEETIETARPDVRFQNVAFSYTAEEPVLHGINCHIQPGEKIAIVGPSGSGKSTMVKLMLGLFRPTTGKVLVGGIDVEMLKKKDLRNQLAYLPQMPFLVQDSIEANLRLVVPGAEKSRLEDCCRAVGLGELIELLPKGLQTNVGENGKALSGGERQRLGAARCLAKDSPVLIMDEMTSALDGTRRGTSADAVCP